MGRLQDVLNCFDMDGIGGSDKIIRLDGQRWPGFPEHIADPVNVFLGRFSRVVCRFGYFVTMFVGTGLETNIFASHFLETTNSIGNDGRICMT